MTDRDYWIECVSCACEDSGISLTVEQIENIADSVSGGHENYGMAFYSPPPSDRVADIERGWQKKLDDLQTEFDGYVRGSERAVKRALHMNSDAQVSIDKGGNVFRHGGRTEQIL